MAIEKGDQLNWSPFVVVALRRAAEAAAMTMDLVGGTSRNTPERRSNQPSRPEAMAMRKRMTPELAAQIKKLAATTDLLQHEIAAVFGINQGRVSEVLSGKRYGYVSPAS